MGLNKKIVSTLPSFLLLASCGHIRFDVHISPPNETQPLPTMQETKTPHTLSPTGIFSPDATQSALPMTTTAREPTTTPHLTLESPAIMTPTPGYWQTYDVYTHDFVAIQTHAGNEPSPFGDIATLQLNDTGLVRLTTSGFNANPVLSPNRELIAYRSVPKTVTSSEDPRPSTYDGYYDIWVTTFDGKIAAQLTTSESQRSVPSWSPDGRRVVFSEGPEGVLVEIDVYSGVRTEVVRFASNPQYFPSGNSIGYLTMDGGLARVDTPGESVAIIPSSTLPSKMSVKDFDWTPDGKHVVFVLADELGRIGDSTLGIKYTLWISRSDGNARVFLAENIRSIRISPDGNFIAAIKGSGYVDACYVDQELVFLALSPDRASVRQIDLKTFQFYPSVESDRTFYPLANVTWLSDQAALAGFHVTCEPGKSPAGGYLINPHLGMMVRFTDQLVSSIEDFEKE